MRAEQLVHPRTLFRQEAGILLVCPPVFDVDFPVRDVPVTTEDVFGRTTLQFLKVRRERVQKAKLGLLPLLARGTGRPRVEPLHPRRRISGPRTT